MFDVKCIGLYKIIRWRNKIQCVLNLFRRACLLNPNRSLCRTLLYQFCSFMLSAVFLFAFPDISAMTAKTDENSLYIKQKSRPDSNNDFG